MKPLQDKYRAPTLEASSKGWMNRSQQWHNLPVTSVGLVIYRLPFEEGTVRDKSSSHRTQLPSHLRNDWPRLLPHSSRSETSEKSLMQQVPGCSSKEVAVVVTGRENTSSSQQCFGGGVGWLGPLPADRRDAERCSTEIETRHTQACCRKATHTRRFHRGHGSGRVTTLRFWLPAIRQASWTPWLMLGKAPRSGVWFLRGGYCSRLLRLFALR